jgi:hypothetical protein
MNINAGKSHLATAQHFPCPCHILMERHTCGSSVNHPHGHIQSVTQVRWLQKVELYRTDNKHLTAITGQYCRVCAS